jgi:ABC-2 type transport system permease protein
MSQLFSFARLGGMIRKEFIQMKRNPIVIAMLIVMPLMQLLLFGYAINLNPKHLSTVVVSNDHTPYTRQFIAAVENTDYFKVVRTNLTSKKASDWLQDNKAQFVLTIPTNFSRDLVRGDKPTILLTADASSPGGITMAVSALSYLQDSVFNSETNHGLAYLKNTGPPFNLMVHNKYNPESITQFSIVPGLIGVILTMTMLLITTVAVVKESEVGTIESLLATPIRPIEVMLGKISPYIIAGYGQQALILLIAKILFGIPFSGSLWLLLLLTFPFIVANLALGLVFSTLAKKQLEAMQMAFFFFLPSILLSGFMFPFYGMPNWAQWMGEVLPMTHYLEIIRGIMLKGSSFVQLWPQVWPLLAFMFGAILLAVWRYRQTLD